MKKFIYTSFKEYISESSKDDSIFIPGGTKEEMIGFIKDKMKTATGDQLTYLQQELKNLSADKYHGKEIDEEIGDSPLDEPSADTFRKEQELQTEGSDNYMNWSKQDLDKDLRSLQQGAKEAGDIDDSMAFDIADGWLSDKPGIEKVIKKHYPSVSDFQGFVANYIA